MGDSLKPDDLKEVVVRICLACGVVNPASPSDTCPHLQLARFDGLDNGLAELLGEVAKARRDFDELVGKLKARVFEALHNHEAEVVTSDKGLKSSARRPPQAVPTQSLRLENPEPVPAKPLRAKRKRSKPAKPLPIDPRQLELIAREPPKGDA